MDRRKFITRVGQAATAVGGAALFPRHASAQPERLTLAALGDCILTR
ncbi:MAG: twin-arginine translocation signal domain-containing protein, partial [Gemmatimonadetes bacterium]|nr:twin-arginine translocation signal domain-containing protein [Gemmatimonadota bacterium]NIR78744.1 twin-arginine translocation signal domain-containing protein [Gemmatimonadota bacterium]NIT87383.1 twin-arginine translocation signal domain-containing protein [Gemmatimonadota bacterium]NIU31233.1 twin-arginine translocation signal domain-containing protein [Gemmatimonadota bacterium]NIU35945.1 twin-arginine translocation signal domain-containing protein [Gemmatimonadota bacterium]